ncbi:MAG TPA: T9SS type A sorting domain-containing protein [Hymenobacter sp.]|nr:T9SS type A sorting domain-containing protein [Hymenobacter sp.]
MRALFYTSLILGKLRAALAALTASLLLASAAWAQAPANDECANATLLTPAATCTPVTTTNANATASAGAPPASQSCFGLSSRVINNDVWYRVVVPASGAVRVVTSRVAGSPLFNTGLALYTGTCGALTEVACNDDTQTSITDTSFSNAFISGLTPGITLYIRVWNVPFGPSQPGPFNICAVSVPRQDANLRILYALGKAPVGVAQTAQAFITNAGSEALTNLPVTLTVTGAASFTTTQTLASLAPGASTTVTFAAYTPPATGTSTLTATIPADDVNTNNTASYTQIITAGTFSYANNQALNPEDRAGYSRLQSAAFIVRYNTPVARALTGITVALADNNTVGRSLYAVVVTAAGAIVARTPDYVVTAADINQRKTFALPTPLRLAPGDFYVGLVQTADAVRPQFNPLGVLPESPTRQGAFFTIGGFSPTTGGTLVDVNETNSGIYVIEAETSVVLGTSSALTSAVSLYPNPSQGQLTLEVRGAQAAGGLQVQVRNMLGQLVHTAQVRDNARSPLDLSGLAEGVYLVRVSTGSEYTLRQLVLTH